MPVTISAIICTHNREHQLRGALESLVAQDLAPADYEVIAVDNACADGTRGVIEDVARGAPQLRYVYESRLGLSNARNRGVAEARGEIVCFIDDDALADAAWLRSLVAAFRQPNVHAACVGGKVLPVWEKPPPTWLPETLYGSLSILDYGERSRPCAFPAEYLIGCNIAFWRTSLIEDGDGFDAALGRRGKNLAGSEEIAIQRRIHDRGGVIYYEASAIVHHHIPKERLSRRWLMRRWFEQGISDALAAQRQHRAMPGPFWRDFAAAGVGVVPVMTSLLRGNQQELIRRASYAAYHAGSAVQRARGRLS